MAILLTILKIIGIILLSILGLILFILCLLLLVPVRYKLIFNKYGDIKDMEGKLSVSWLLHLIHCSLCYHDKDLVLKFRIIGIKIKQISLIKKDVSQNIISEKDKTAKSVITNSSSEKKQLDYASEKTIIEEYDDYKIETMVEDSDVTSKVCSEIDEHEKFTDSMASDDIVNENDKRNSIDKFKEFFKTLYITICNIINGISDFCNNVEHKISEIENKIENIDKELTFYERFIEDDRNKAAIANCFRQLRRIIKAIRPRKVKGNISFGMEDPATTGQILSVISVLYPYTYNKIKIDADFDNKIFEGDILIKGRITVVVLVIAAWKVYFNKDLKRLLRIYKKHKYRDIRTKEDKK